MSKGFSFIPQFLDPANLGTVGLAMDFLGTLAIGVEVLGVKRRKALERQLEAESKDQAKMGFWVGFLRNLRPPKGDQARTHQQRFHILITTLMAYVITIISVTSQRDLLVFRVWFAAVDQQPLFLVFFSFSRLFLALATVLLVMPGVILTWAVALNRPLQAKHPVSERFLATVSVVTMVAFYPALFGYAIALLTIGTLTTLATIGVNRLLLYSFRLKKKYNLPSALAVFGLILVTLGFFVQLFARGR